MHIHVPPSLSLIHSESSGWVGGGGRIWGVSKQEEGGSLWVVGWLALVPYVTR